MEEEIKTTKGQTFIECIVTCPYCKTAQDRIEDLRESFDIGSPSFSDWEVELGCEECNRIFIVDEVTF